MLNKLNLIVICLFFTAYSCAQTKLCKNYIEADIDNLMTPFDKDNLLTDTLSKKIALIFEQTFDDSVVIKVDTRILYKAKLKTRKFLGVCDSSFNVDYSGYAKPPKISVFLPGRKECISFYPKHGKQLAYINLIQKGWSIELSNLVREYR